MLRTLFAIVELVGVPTLVFFAWRGWLRGVRANLPPWRNGLGLTALLLVSLSWSLAAITVISGFAHFQIIDPMWSFKLSQPLGIVAALLAVALKGAPRFLAVLAGLLMLAFWVPFIII